MTEELFDIGEPYILLVHFVPLLRWQSCGSVSEISVSY